jgi:exonuclease SbcC
MPERLNEVKEKTSIVELALANLNSIKMKVSEIQNRVNEARALDAALNEKDLHRNNLQASLLEKQRASDAAKISISDIAAKESSCNQSLSVVVGEINSIVNGDALVEVLSALRILIQGWQEQAIAVDQIEEKVQQIKAIIAIEEGAKATLKTELEVLLSRLAAIEQDVQKAMSEMQQLSQGKTLVQLASELSSLSSKASSLKELAAYFESSDNLTILLTELAEKTVKAEQKKIELVQAKQHAISKLGSAEEKESLLDKQLDLERRIQSLEIQRKALKGGEPCPLCGALEHPFTAGHNESTNETEAALKKHKTDLKLMRAELNSIDVSFGQTETELLGLEKSQLSASVELKKVSGKIEISQAQFDEFKGDISMAAIRVQLAKVENGQKILAKVINDVEALEQRVAAGNVSRNSISDQKILIEQRLAATIQNAEAELRSLESCQQDLAGAKEQLRLSKSHIDDRLSPFQVFPDGSDNYPGILEKLTRLSDKRLQKLIEKERLESEIVRFAADKGKQSAMLTELLAMVTEFDRQLQLAESERQISWALRVSLIGERPLKEIESENDKNLNEVIQVHDSAAKSLQLAVQTLGLLENQNKELKERVFTLDAEIQREESDFSIQVAALGFAGESEFLAAKLPLDALQALELEDKLLERENDQLKRLSVELEEALTLLQAKKNFTETVDAISSMVDGLKQSENEVSEQIGAIKSRLHENQKLREEFEGKAEILRRQQKDFDKWDELHSLIGSADGKKFRNFAQGLTFDLVLANANRHLQKMSDRYLLVRDNSSPLDLNVIDNYQSSEVRSAKNLSGGESFIVSLALALGLSQMASHNVRVDSLFLDEGFGSLDEDALELAIEALASLQQQGKMIGLISHIESVKERISTQISVVPQANGRSCLVGPGCSAK